MVVATLSEEVFACYRRSCAPPPVGKGGSNRGGARGGDKARKGGIAAAKAKSSYFNKKKLYNADEETGKKLEHQAVVRKGKIARHKAGGKMKNTGDENPGTAYDKYRELQAKNRAKKSPKAEASELRRGGTETLKGVGSWNGGKLGRYKNGQYYVKPPNSSPIPLAARSKQAAYDEITKRK